ncbi:MAG: vitamin K epoxide reductase family protein [Desulfuromonadaceae bacterium]|nr:vitamin K epoxide reductase family protein [Desulfuromonadaceae bacterium]MDD5105503.1 vitamin K epoxide reductase family protein [Desulfuromonadaceae bacterium]
MAETDTSENTLPVQTGNRALSLLIWVAVSTGWLVSIISLINELCLATACSDAAVFTIFGVGLGWFGIAYFSVILCLLWLRRHHYLIDWVLSAALFSGVGAEFRLLWIQKFIIGSWCPFCVAICCSLFTAALLILIRKVLVTAAERGTGSELPKWLAGMALMAAVGLLVATIGIHALS